MSHNARLDRLEGSIAPDRTPELDAAIEREIEAMKRAHPDTWEERLAGVMADVMAQSRTETDIR